MLNVMLKVVGGDMGTNELQLDLPAILGRGRDVSVNLAHPLVSRRHCELVEAEGGYVLVRDLGSLNGTFVGSNQIREARLKPGDLLTVGTVTFRAVYDVAGSDDTAPIASANGDTAKPEKRKFETVRIDMTPRQSAEVPHTVKRVSST